MDLRNIIEDYEAGRLGADEALELSNCVSLVAMYQLLDQQAAELDAIRIEGNEAGADLRAHAGECPYTPRDTMRHRSWMDGFSEGRVAAQSAVASALSGS